MKIEYKKSKSAATVPHIGMVFEGTISAHTGLFLRTFSGFVLLEDPSITYHSETISGPWRERQVTLVVED